MFFRVVALIVIVILIFYALFTFLKYFSPKENKPEESKEPLKVNPTPQSQPEEFLKKVELEIELLQVKLQECEAEIKAGIVGSETRLESLKASLERVEKLKEEYSNKK
jgi:hypothetical protein